MFIDPHVHCRDGKQAYKETIKHALSVAERAGFTAIFDMPNIDPPITRREHVVERLKIAEKANSPVFYGIHMAMTADISQIKEAVDAYKEFPQVVGFKLYAGHSVGNIGIIDIKDQQRIYATLRDCGYEGVLVVHCEKESLLKPDLWDPQRPVTHALARPPEAEIESLKDQIMLAQESGFEGTLHVTHISVPEAVEIVNNAKRKMHITCAATPHHLILDSSVMQSSNGLLYKINPPIRTQGMANKLLSYLKQGKIGWIETDHSPQTLDEKLNPPYMSGIPRLHYYPRFINWLRAKGFSEQQIKDLTFNNAAKAYGISLKPRQAVPSLELGSEYPFDPFKNIF